MTKQIITKNLTWTNLIKPNKKEAERLALDFGFHPLDIKDILPPLQRPKLVSRSKYLFMILLFPRYNRSTREIESSEVDFFITPSHLTTIQDGQLQPLVDLFKSYQENERKRIKYFNSNSTLLYEILNCLLNYCFPMLNHISLDIDKIEKEIFAGQEKEMVREISILKRNIVNFRKTMQGHKNVIKKLIEKAPRFFSTIPLTLYFNSLFEYTKDIWDQLENYKETIEALHETNESLLSFQLNQIIKTLTIFSVIVFPLTLLASIFSMDISGTPLVNMPNAFWIIIGIMLGGALIMFLIFKKKRWL